MFNLLKLARLETNILPLYINRKPLRIRIETGKVLQLKNNQLQIQLYETNHQSKLVEGCKLRLTRKLYLCNTSLGGKFNNMYPGFTLHINFLYKILNKIRRKKGKLQTLRFVVDTFEMLLLIIN